MLVLIMLLAYQELKMFVPIHSVKTSRLQDHILKLAA